jgi:hypothetical protein
VTAACPVCGRTMRQHVNTHRLAAFEAYSAAMPDRGGDN